MTTQRITFELARRLLAMTLIGSAILTGCTTRRQGVDMSGFRAAMANPVSGFHAAGEMPAANVLSTPETVVLARVSAHAQQQVQPGPYPPSGSGRVTEDHRTGLHYGSAWRSEDDRLDVPWVVDEGVNERQEILALSGAKSSRVVLMSQLVNTPTRMHTQNIIETAKQRGAQWLCVFSAQTEYEEMLNKPLWPLQLLTLGLMPTTSDATSEIEMMIIDLQSNTVVDQWLTKETGWQPAVGLTYKEASEQSADRAETRAMRAVIDRLDRRIRGEAVGEPRRINAGMWE